MIERKWITFEEAKEKWPSNNTFETGLTRAERFMINQENSKRLEKLEKLESDVNHD